MSNSSRFAVAVHALAVLALKHDRPVSSADLADSIGTNPAFVRQILMQLKAAGLVKARLGKMGGSLLGNTPESITLLDVYDAVEGTNPVFVRHKSSPSEDCVVGRHILTVLDEVTAPAEDAFRTELAGSSIATVVDQIGRHTPAG